MAAINQKKVLVIGEGIAGITAAAAAACKGASVTLVTTGPGTFAFASGFIEIHGMITGEGAAAILPDRLQESIRFFQKFAATAGVEISGSLEETRWLPTIMGTFHAVNLAPGSIWNIWSLWSRPAAQAFAMTLNTWPAPCRPSTSSPSR